MEVKSFLWKRSLGFTPFALPLTYRDLRKGLFMGHIKEGSASLSLLGGRSFQFATQRVIPCSGHRSLGFGYSPLSVEKNDLRRLAYEPEVQVKGMVIDDFSGRILANARIEVWHRSPKTGDRDHRAHFYTDDQGRYRFITDWPAREEGKSYHIFFKISYKHQSYFTKLSFNHSLALISSISTAAKSQKYPPAAELSFLPKNTRASFQLNIGVPINTEEFSTPGVKDIRSASL